MEQRNELFLLGTTKKPAITSTCGLNWYRIETEWEGRIWRLFDEGDNLCIAQVQVREPQTSSPEKDLFPVLYVARKCARPEIGLFGFSKGNYMTFELRTHVNTEMLILEWASDQVRVTYEGLEPVEKKPVLGDVPPEGSDKLDGLLLDVRMAQVEPSICDLKGLSRRHNELSEAVAAALAEIRRRLDVPNS